MSTTIEPLGRQDLEILRLESGTIAGHALKIALVRPTQQAARLDVEALRDRVAERLPNAPRLRCKLRARHGRCGAAWVDDPTFDVREHVRPLAVSEPVSEDELRHVVARALQERLDRSRPLWTLDVLDRTIGGDVCVIWKIHHAMADGVTALRFVDQVLWDAPTQAQPSAAAAPLPTRTLDRLARALSARRPGRLPPTLRRELRRTRQPSPFDGAIGGTRTVAFASLPLGALKRAAKAQVATATVNDVVLALVAGAIRRSAAAPPLGAVRVKVPVSLHQEGERLALANRDSFFVISLPVDEADPVQRLRRISAETALCKRTGDALVLDTLLGDLARVAPPLRRTVERLAGHPRAFTLSVSNLAGPVQRPTLLGAPVRALYSIAEVGERHGLRVTVVSMADELHFGLSADSAIVSDLDPLLNGIRAEASALLEHAAAAENY